MPNKLLSLSPLDGRYVATTEDLQLYFSEFALIKYRLWVEIIYFIKLAQTLPQLKGIDPSILEELKTFHRLFSLTEAQKIKQIEQEIKHDVKAIEYYLQKKFIELGIKKYIPFIHFGLTSQDINNTAIPLSLKESFNNNILPNLKSILHQFKNLSKIWGNVVMLAFTHGQPASPTYLGKEIAVFAYRLGKCLKYLEELPITAKFGGAVGNFNAHYLAYPNIDWIKFADSFVGDLKLKRNILTTQIDNYDDLAAIFNACVRINTVLIDFCRDIWQYIALDYFKQKMKKEEVGSSTMPHKINPIDFENAEGNLGLSIAIFTHLSQKLPISRLQRDLSDSTVLKNIGVPFGHQLIALNSIKKGLKKLILNPQAIRKHLNENWAIIGEGVQTILRREGIKDAYELLKAFTRNHEQLNQQAFLNFIDSLPVSEQVKKELTLIKPENYVGVKPNLE